MVVVRADLLEDLKAAKDYFLLAKGEFYHTFLQDSRQLMSLPPPSTVNNELNMVLSQTKFKLGLEDDEKLKLFKMSLKSYSFTYKNFSTLNGLACIGNVDVSSTTHAYRIKSDKNHLKSGALWHSLKQRIENGFQTHFGFRFRNQFLHGGGAGSVMNQSMVSYQDGLNNTTLNNLNH